VYGTNCDRRTKIRPDLPSRRPGSTDPLTRNDILANGVERPAGLKKN
jgi:hypothetical protein